MWKNANPIQERISWAATLLPWWVNLILAEVSFIILYLMSSGLVAQIIIPSLFAGASMVSTLKSDREKEELQRLRKETAKNRPEPEPEAIKPDLKTNELRRVKKNQVDIENMPVTKVIVKDLMKGTYREIYHKPRNWEPKEENCREEEQRRERRNSEAIIGVSIALFLSTAIATWIYIYFTPKEEQVAVNIPKPEPQKQTVQHVSYTSPVRPSPTPIQSQQNWKQYAYSKQPDDFEIEKPIPIEDDSIYEGSKEKIYTWNENGIHHYTNLKDVAKSKKAVELK